MNEKVKLTDKQTEAGLSVQKWYDSYYFNKETTDQIFRLFGYAGTGKSTITQSIIDMTGLVMGEDVSFAAFAGKAAMVMQNHGLPASTIHSLIYETIEPDDDLIKSLYKQLNNCTNEGDRMRIRQLLVDAQKPKFRLKTKNGSNLKNKKLLVLDECSMINENMLKDLLTFDIPLLVLGDPGQLPPIEGKSPLIDVKPNVMLTEIHRQAANNPIIYLATCARMGRELEYGEYGYSRVIPKSRLNERIITKFDQILVGKNATRRGVNRRMREILGYEGLYPNVGEKIICLRNEAEKGLYNGMVCYVEEVGAITPNGVELIIKKEFGDTRPFSVVALKAHFDSYQKEDAVEMVHIRTRLNYSEFDYAYGITVHKAQGSQWDNVCLIDDGMFCGFGKPGDREKWLYTGITRAAENIVVAS